MARLGKRERQALHTSKKLAAKAARLGASDNMRSTGQGFASAYRANGVPNVTPSNQWGFNYRKHASMLRKAGLEYSAAGA